MTGIKGGAITRMDADIERLQAEASALRERYQQAEDALSQMRSTLEATADGLLVVGLDRKVKLFNQLFLSMWRIPDELAVSGDDNRLLGFVLEQLRAPDSFIEKVNALYSEPASDSYDLIEFKDGRIFERYSRPQFMGREIIGRVWCFRDVTRQMGIEQAREDNLSASEKKYRTLFDFANDAVFVADAESGIIIDANRKSEELLGLPRREIIGLHQTELHPKDETGLYRKEFEAHVQSGGTTSAILHVSHKAGYLIPVEISSNVAVINGRRLVFGIFRDVTERESARKLQENQYRHLREIMDAITSPLYVINVKDYTVSLANKATGLHNMGGLATCHALTHGSLSPCSGEDHRCTVEEVKKSRGPVTIQHIHKDIEGAERYHEINAYPVFDDNGEIVQVIEYAVDITERKRLEDEFIRREKLESIGQLAGGIAHDFNNMLSIIINDLAYLENNISNPEKVSGKLANTKKVLEQATGLSQQLLAFTRGGNPVKRAVSISSLLRSNARMSLSGSRIRPVFSLPEDLWYVEADPGQLNQVLSNLLINAWQATPEGGTVEIAAENVMISAAAGLPINEGNYVKIIISDHGCGIEKENLARIFEPYFTTKKDGSGLGLAISYSIIKRHGGLVEVSSEVGRGTTFTIHIPANPDIVTVEGSIERPLEGAVAARDMARVLILEDEPLLGTVVREMLADLGYEVAIAVDGDKAVEIFQNAISEKRPFDAVVLDLTIVGGKMGGKETMKKLREMAPGIKAIVTSGYSGDHVMTNFWEYGFSDVIPKPYHVGELNQKLKNLLNIKY